MGPSKENFCFEVCKTNLQRMELPSENWSYVKGSANFCGFLKIEDTNVTKKVIILKDLSVRVFVNEEINPLSEFMKIATFEEINRLLDAVDKMT